MIPHCSAVSFWTLVKTLPVLVLLRDARLAGPSRSVPRQPPKAYPEKTGAPAHLLVWWGAEGGMWCPACVCTALSSFPREEREAGWVWSQGLHLFQHKGKLHLHPEQHVAGLEGERKDSP